MHTNDEASLELNTQSEWTSCPKHNAANQHQMMWALMRKKKRKWARVRGGVDERARVHSDSADRKNRREHGNSWKTCWECVKLISCLDSFKDMTCSSSHVWIMIHTFSSYTGARPAVIPQTLFTETDRVYGRWAMLNLLVMTWLKKKEPFSQTWSDSLSSCTF